VNHLVTGCDMDDQHSISDREEAFIHYGLQAGAGDHTPSHPTYIM
jgi:hypothetical protein